MIRELTSRIRVLRAWIEIHRRPPVHSNSFYVIGWNEGGIEILRSEVRWLIKMLRIAKRFAALLLVIPIWWS